MKFSDLDLHPSLVAGIEKNKFVECTPIQEKAIPLVLDGKDVAGLAQTGTGKTAAFVLPLIERILRAQELEMRGLALHGDEIVEAQTKELERLAKQKAEAEADAESKKADGSNGEITPINKRAFLEWEKSNYILVLVPTRELAEQVYQNVVSLGTEAGIRSTAIYGGTAYDKQKKAIGHGLEFIIATPGRLIDLYKEHIVDLRQVKAVVFDEADRMFDMGFKDDMKYILKRIPSSRQMLVFSATLNFDVLNVCYEFGSDPVEINVSKDQPKAENVDDEIFHVGHDEKPMYLLSVLKKTAPRQAIVFSNFKRNVERITQFLNKNGIPAVGISSLMTQAQRNRVMGQFKGSDESYILVATDLAARGLDIKGVDCIFNYELPDDAENYVHRIGRTGRAGAKGHAFSFVGDRDVDALRRIEEYLGHKVEIGWLEDEFLLKDFVGFPRERDLSPYPNKPRSMDNKRGGGRGGERNDRGPRRGPRRNPRRDDPKRTRDAKDKEGSDQKERPAREAASGERPQRKRNRNRNRNRNRRPEGETDTKKEGSVQASSGSAHRDRTTGRHGGTSSQDKEGSKNRNRRRRKPRGPQDKNRQAKASGGATRKKSAPKQAVAQKSLGKKVSGFIKKIFGN